MGKLSGKIALITGASRGIGRGIAVEMAKQGAQVVINYSKDDEGANKTLEEIKKLLPNSYICNLDGIVIK